MHEYDDGYKKAVPGVLFIITGHQPIQCGNVSLQNGKSTHELDVVQCLAKIGAATYFNQIYCTQNWLTFHFGDLSDIASALVFHGNLESLEASRLADAIANRTSEVYRVNADDVVINYKIEYCESPAG